MTPRPLISSSRRPVSAIFLGSLPPKEQVIPNFPEPPESPSAISSSSGLPSPPATNSTGSGSTGDNKSPTPSSLRQRPASYAGSVNMPHRNYDTPSTPEKSSRNIDDDDDDENDYSNEEDDTARLDRSHAIKSPNENLMALQRVKSLAERNRMALNKLSSFSRTPSPANSRASRSPLPPIHASTSSSSSSAASRISSHSRSNIVTRQYDGALQYDSALSGSETERESQRAPTPSYSNSHSNSRSYGSSSPERPSTSPPSTSTRERRISAPASPARSRRPSPAPSHTPRKRVSIASALSVPRDNAAYDVTSAALAAVASSRRSPTGTGSVNRRSRQPLPREFRDGDRVRTLDSRTSIEPMTPHHNSRQDSYTSNANTSHRTSSYTNPNPQYSPRGTRANLPSTVRELTRRHQTRWLSDDISNLPDSSRKQTQRGGSAESTLGVGGRLVGEGLRAAGIGMRNGTQTNDDVFAHSNGSHVSLRRARTAASGTRRNVEWEDEHRVADDRSRASGSSGTRLSEGVGPSTRPHLSSDPSRASSSLLVERDLRGARTASSRPATSMAEFYHEEDENSGRGAASLLRSRRQYSGIERQHSGASPGIRPLPPQQAPAAPTPPDRSRSVALTRRHTTMTPLGNGSVSSHQQSAEHTKLMLESLKMFENVLSRLPNQSASAPDLFRSAETIVLASEKLNALLRTGTNRALEQQIDAEMDDETSGTIPTGEIWRRVGGEYRESLRVSDEVVRTITGFLLGIGRIVKEASAGALNEPGPQHSRSGLDDDVSRRTPEIDRSSNRSRQDGRRSVESRRSWEPSAPTADLSRRLSGHDEGVVVRPPSSRDRDPEDQPLFRKSLPLPPLPLSATRRLFTPREHRDRQMTSNALASHNSSSDIVDLSLEYEPSPTPAARGVPAGRQKPLPSLAVPPPLPTLPSESLMSKLTSNSLDKSNYRKSSTTSAATIRGMPLPLANPTTAVTTHTVSNSPENSTFPLSRVDSKDSVRSSVTFSRPSEVSLSALQQQHIRDEARRKAIMSSANTEEDANVPRAPSPAQVRSPLSGSETERDTRRRTFGVRAARMSLDSIRDEREGDNGSSQSRTVTIPSQRRERRRTVTEVFS
ncbi:uncharacterized protein EDB93DRAFT_1253304 [Suillus bovinus]|uniref:uncharacterized protein n=1 Tax=Suillus bovinus TaxID=48563 RepID=UPI001B86E690|nr:uncharacterized protein EDB93DRAFT_1253304 [Suillus bovinus]KAG2138599.1 hypothetical protein EDB93DRAFT_1253304 [Suillus bovinus]